MSLSVLKSRALMRSAFNPEGREDRYDLIPAKTGSKGTLPIPPKIGI